jgi:hypothetical protein
MRNMRMVGGFAVAICVLAVTAAPTMAHQFVSSKLGTSVGHGFNEIPVESGVPPEYEPARMQEWNLGSSFRILCYKSKLNGEITETESQTFTTTVRFEKCGWYPSTKNHLHIAATWGKSGMKVVYHATGWTETLGNGEGETFEYKAKILETSAYIKIPSGNSSTMKLCEIVIPEQTIPVRAIAHPEEEFSSAVYSNEEVPVLTSKTFPTGLQKRLVIANNFTKLKFKYVGETQCATGEEFEKQSEEGGGGIAGSWKGVVEAWVPGGNLSFVP